MVTCPGLSKELGFVDTIYQQDKLGFEPSLIAVGGNVSASNGIKTTTILAF